MSGIRNKFIFLLCLVITAALLGQAAAFAQNTVHEESDYEVSYEMNGDTFIITNSRTIAATDITAVKQWEDADNQDNLRPDSVSFQLYRNGLEYGGPKTVIPDGSGNWTAHWENVPLNDAGVPAVFTVGEIDTPEGYEQEAGSDGLTIINRHEIFTRMIDVDLGWLDDDNRDGIRPDSVTVVIRHGSDIIDEIILSQDNGFRQTIEVPVNAPGKSGEPNTLTAEITDLREEYDYTPPEPSEGDIHLEASHVPERVDIIVNIVWEDNNDQDRLRPDSVNVEISGAEGSEAKDVTGSGNGWKVTFPDQYKYSGGTLNEFSVSGGGGGDAYTTTTVRDNDYEFTIVNKHETEKISHTPKIVWNDDNNRDGIRPESLTVRITANGSPTDITADVDEGCGWQHTFGDLDTNISGSPVNYAFQVIQSVPGYTYEFSEDKWTITYTHLSDTVTCTGELKWDDNNNNDGLRPENVTFELYRNGEPTGDRKTVSEDGEKAVWTDLDRRENGDEISYTVRQVESLEPDYSTSYEDSPNSTIVTNIHGQELKTIHYTVIWIDNDDQDGLRPASLTIRLSDDIQGQKEQNIRTEESTFEGAFEDLPVIKNGEVIRYDMTVIPNPPTGYTVDIRADGTEEERYIITLTHEPDKTHLFTIVEWDDMDDIDGIRPDSIDVCLKANSDMTPLRADLPIYGSYANDFRYLDKKADGSDIIYSVTLCNDVPDGYTMTQQDNSRIILHHKPGNEPGDRISKTVRKEWDDDEDNKQIRPNMVSVSLLADGAVKETVDLEENAWGQWVYTFTDLPARNAYGRLIDYSVTEKQVNGYKAPRYTVDRFTIVNSIGSGYSLPEKRVSVRKAAGNSDKLCVENDTVQITLWVENTGRTALFNVGVRDRLPEGAVYVEGSAKMTNISRGTDSIRAVEYEEDRFRIDANISWLPVNGKIRITYSVLIDDPKKISGIAADFNYGTEYPLETGDPQPPYQSNIAAPCIPQKQEPAPAPKSGGNAPVSELPRTGFAPNRITDLPPQRSSYAQYSVLRIEIPKLGVDAEILGVPFDDGDWDVTWLGGNIGWLQGTAYPGTTGPGNTVLTGHLTDNLGRPGIFSGLENLSYGDTFTITGFGESYTYIVSDVMTVYADTPEVLSQETLLPEVTLITCKYYDETSDSYKGRIVVKASLQSIAPM